MPCGKYFVASKSFATIDLRNLKYEFDVTESTSMNSGSKIINVQWDFDYRNRFSSTRGYSFLRGKKNESLLKVEYTFPSAGKTGTAQWNSNKNTHEWFTSFAPYDQPEIVVTVMLEEGGEGSATAVPVAKSVLQTWWNLRTSRQGAF